MFGDINGDGVLEVVLGTSSGVVVVLSGISGRDVAPFPFRTHGSLHSQVTDTSPAPPGMARYHIANAGLIAEDPNQHKLDDSYTSTALEAINLHFCRQYLSGWWTSTRACTL